MNFYPHHVSPREHKHSHKTAILNEMVVLISNRKFVGTGKDNIEVFVCACKVADKYSPVGDGDPELFAQ